MLNDFQAQSITIAPSSSSSSSFSCAFVPYINSVGVPISARYGREPIPAHRNWWLVQFADGPLAQVVGDPRSRDLFYSGRYRHFLTPSVWVEGRESNLRPLHGVTSALATEPSRPQNKIHSIYIYIYRGEQDLLFCEQHNRTYRLD